MKDTRFLTHDCNARSDPKLLQLQMRLGGEGLGIYWCIVEMLWENDGYLPLDYDIIAFTLRWATVEKVKSVVEDFDLFEQDGTQFWSRSALERIEEKRGIIEQRREAGRKGRAVQLGIDMATPEQRPDTAQAKPQQMLGSLFIYLLNNKNKTFSFSFSKDDEQEMLAAAFTFSKNIPKPNREVQKFLAFNNSDGRVWDEMPEKMRRKAFEAWEQKPQRPPRFDHDFLIGWAKVCDALAASGAPKRVRLAALSDEIKYDALKEKYTLWIPDVLRDWIEGHIPEVGSVLMREIVQPAGHSALCYRKCAESVK